MKFLIITLLTLLFSSQVMSKSNHQKLKDRCFDGYFSTRTYEASKRCHSVGDLYYEGGRRWVKGKYRRNIKPPKSYERALVYYKKACEQSRALSQSCNKVSDMYTKGEGVNRNFEKAFSYARKSCNLLNVNKATKGSKGCINLARMYTNGEGVEANDYKAASSYLRDCKFNGNSASCKQALITGSYACNSGNIDSCFLISDMYKKLKVKYFDKANIDNAPDKSNEYLIKACELKSSRACAEVAINYMGELGVKKDVAKVIKYTKKSCGGSPSYMCTTLSGFYTDGKLIKKNSKLAIKYLTMGCNKGDKQSCAILGIKYVNGTGVKQSYKKALENFKEGCKYGSAISCKNTAIMYLKGDGIKINRTLALKYFIDTCKTDGKYRKNDCEKLTDKQLPKTE